MIAVDLPVLALLAGVVVLVVSTMLTALTLPPPSRLRRWRRALPRPLRRFPSGSDDEPIVIRHRRVVTGRPPVMPITMPVATLPRSTAPASTPAVDVEAVEVPGRREREPARRQAGDQDGRGRDGVSRAEAEIEQLLDTDPERIARLMMQWIRDDRTAGS